MVITVELIILLRKDESFYVQKKKIEIRVESRWLIYCPSGFVFRMSFTFVFQVIFRNLRC